MLVVPGDGRVRLEKLAFNEDQAGLLGVEPGPLTAARAEHCLAGDRGTGALQRVKSAKTPDDANQVADRLARTARIVRGRCFGRPLLHPQPFGPHDSPWLAISREARSHLSLLPQYAPQVARIYRKTVASPLTPSCVYIRHVIFSRQRLDAVVYLAYHR